MSWTEGEIDRRQFLKGAAKNTAAVFLLVNPSLLTPQLASPVRRIEFLDEIYGSNPLTFDQALTYHAPVAKLCAGNTSTSPTASELEENTYIVRGNFQTARSQSLAQLGRDYQAVNLSDNDIWALLTSLSEGVSGAAFEDKVFLYLDKINDNRYASYQYYLKGDEIRSVSETLAVRYRTTNMHEYMHKVSNPEVSMAVRPEILNLVMGDMQETVSGSDQRAFSVAVYLPYHQGTGLPQGIVRKKFNEFVTDYLAAKRFLSQGLCAAEGFYADSADVVNFRRVLTQMEMTDDELLDHYKNSRITEFMVRLGRAAENVHLDNDIERLRFAYRRTIGLSDLPMDWSYYKPFFPAVDLDLPHHYFASHISSLFCSNPLMGDQSRFLTYL